MPVKTRLVLLLVISSTAIWLLPGCHQTKGPFKNGLYQSTEESYKQNFFLEIDGQQASLYGWSVDRSSDTTYYKVAARFRPNNSLSFKNYSYSKHAYNPKNLCAFPPTDNTELLLFGYTSFNNISQINKAITLNGSMMAYNSRADQFVFKLVE